MCILEGSEAVSNRTVHHDFSVGRRDGISMQPRFTRTYLGAYDVAVLF